MFRVQKAWVQQTKTIIKWKLEFTFDLILKRIHHIKDKFRTGSIFISMISVSDHKEYYREANPCTSRYFGYKSSLTTPMNLQNWTDNDFSMQINYLVLFVLFIVKGKILDMHTWNLIDSMSKRFLLRCLTWLVMQGMPYFLLFTITLIYFKKKKLRGKQLHHAFLSSIKKMHSVSN